MSDTVMTPISPDDAEARYGIVARHSEMTGNKERRFRLEKDDGTAYIRTEASVAGGWQNSHHHEHSTETYIVQSGWMAAAEFRSGATAIYRFGPGEVYSTEPRIVHNVYLPANAVIHTIKHGPAARGDWHGNTQPANDLNDLTRNLTEADISARAAPYPSPAAVQSKEARLQSSLYSDSYRHFDQLVWQVPAWSSAVFALAAASIADNSVFFQQLGAQTETRVFNSVAGFWAALYCVVFAALAVFGLALYRFRRRQGTEATSRVPFIKSASFWSMSLVALESAFFLAVALITAGLSDSLSVVLAAGYLLVIVVASEVRLRRSPQLVSQRHS
ncbi:MAG: hypothetical protein AB7H66_05505 [Hyphomonadaceae bacterium]